MLRKRLIVSLDIRDGRVVKFVGGGEFRDAGDPVVLARRYAEEGVDEMAFLDSSETPEGRRALLEVVSRTAQMLTVPLTVGGGLNEVADIALTLRAGADKVTINTAGVKRPELIGEASVRFGKQCVIASIDARLEKRQIELVTRTEGNQAQQQTAPVNTGSWFRVFTHSGSTATELDAIAWARQCAAMGAGEIMVTSIDHGNTRGGYDLELTARIVEAVNLPVIAGGSLSTPEHIRDVFLLAGADAAMASGIHDGATSVEAVKRILAAAGIPIREADSPLASQ